MKLNYFAPIALTTVISLCCSTITSACDLLYGVNAVSGEFSTIDLTDGSRTLISNVGSNNGIGAMTYDISRDTLFSASSELLTIDRQNGITSSVGAFSTSINGLAYDSELDQLLGLDLIDRSLVRVDRDTAAIETIGSLGTTVAEITFDPITNTLWGVDNTTNSLYSIDRTTGEASLIGTIGFNGVLGVASDATGDLYAADVGSVGAFTQLLKVDKNTGAGTTIGPPRSSFVVALAFAPAPVPEPSGTMLVLFGITVCVCRRQRLKINRRQRYSEITRNVDLCA